MILKESDRLLCDDNKIAYRLLSGSALVFLAPKKDGKPVRQMYIGEMTAGSVIPGLREIREDSDLKIEFSFYVVPAVACEIEITENDSSYLSMLMEDSGYNEEHGYQESDSCIDNVINEYYEYRNNSRLMYEKKESQHLKSEERKKEILINTFNKGIVARTADGSDEALYDVISFWCNKSRIDIVDYDEIILRCGENFSLEDIARASGFTIRKVNISEDDFKGELQPLLFYKKDTDTPVVVYKKMCCPLKMYDGEEGSERKLSKGEISELSMYAYSIVRPLNDDKVDGKAIFKFMIKEISFGDIVISLATMMAITLVGLLLGTINKSVYDYVIPSGDVDLLVELGLLLIAFMVGSLLFTICRSISTYRMASRIKYSLQAAIYNRIFHMPELFYRRHDSAELAYRAGTLASNYSNLFNFSVQIILQGGFAWFYYSKMHNYSHDLSHIGSVMVVFSMILTVVLGRTFQSYQSKRTLFAGKIKSYLYQVIKGIEVIRTMGAEDMVLNEYTEKLSEYSSLDYKYSKMQNIGTVITSTSSAIVTLIMYSLMAEGKVGISIGTFMGFSSVYGCFGASMISVAQNALNIFSMIPMLRNSTEILKYPMEPSNRGMSVKDIQGDINISDVNFAYAKDSENVLENFNLHIKPGEYVAIVGSSGCGKSTLLRLLLGFERPQKGKISYDSINMNNMNMPDFRRKIGVVIQDGGIFNGSIQKNIRLNKTNVTEEEIWDVLEKVGLKSDIEKMPMGLNTHVSEQAQNISGGQKQRILIARALVGDPQILFLDEATSSLDNETQNIVKNSIDSLNITRVVIAHRLTTIKNCDRILVIDNGSIAEEGTYEELIEKEGLFKELVDRQLV